MEPPLEGPDIGDIRDPDSIRCRHGKILFEPVRSNNRRLANPVSGLFIPTNRPEAVDPHETGHAMVATALSVFPEIPVDPNSPLNSCGGGRESAAALRSVVW